MTNTSCHINFSTQRHLAASLVLQNGTDRINHSTLSEVNCLNTHQRKRSFGLVTAWETEAWDKMATVLQTAFSNAFPWMKLVFWWKFHRNSFLRVKLTLGQHLVQIMPWHWTGDPVFKGCLAQNQHVHCLVILCLYFFTGKIILSMV